MRDLFRQEKCQECIIELVKINCSAQDTRMVKIEIYFGIKCTDITCHNPSFLYGQNFSTCLARNGENFDLKNNLIQDYFLQEKFARSQDMWTPKLGNLSELGG